MVAVPVHIPTNSISGPFFSTPSPDFLFLLEYFWHLCLYDTDALQCIGYWFLSTDFLLWWEFSCLIQLSPQLLPVPIYYHFLTKYLQFLILWLCNYSQLSIYTADLIFFLVLFSQGQQLPFLETLLLGQCWVFIAACRLSPVVASRAEWRGQEAALRSLFVAREPRSGGLSGCGAQALGTWASVVAVPGLSCPVACRIFQTRDWTGPSHCKASFPGQAGKPWLIFFPLCSLIILAPS